jgi:hypothetical protein
MLLVTEAIMDAIRASDRHTDEALRALVDRGVITAAQAAEVRLVLTRPPPPTRRGRWWAELAGYLGAVLVLGGVSLLVGSVWDTLGTAARAATLAATAALLAAGGLVIAGGRRVRQVLAAGAHPGRRRVVGTLFAVASAAAAGVAAVLAGGHEAMAAGAAGLLAALAGYAALPTVAGLLASAAASVLLGWSAVAEAGADRPYVIGSTLVLLGAMWTVLAVLGVAAPRSVGLSVGAGFMLVGTQQMLGEPGGQAWAYGSTVVVAAACFALYRRLPQSVLLFAGVLGIAVAAPEAVWDWTGGTVGGAAILLVAGGALVTASAVGLGLRRVGPPVARAGGQLSPP